MMTDEQILVARARRKRALSETMVAAMDAAHGARTRYDSGASCSHYGVHELVAWAAIAEEMERTASALEAAFFALVAFHLETTGHSSAALWVGEDDQRLVTASMLQCHRDRATDARARSRAQEALRSADVMAVCTKLVPRLDAAAAEHGLSIETTTVTPIGRRRVFRIAFFRDYQTVGLVRLTEEALSAAVLRGGEAELVALVLNAIAKELACHPLAN